MISAIDNYFLKHEEPVKGCLLFLRTFILKQDPNLREAWKYGMPFYCYKDKMCCYLWVHKKFKQPYIGFVEGDRIKHPDLMKEKRARMSILLIDPAKDIQIKKIASVMTQMLRLYNDQYA